jgi:hypothetical protein
MGFSLHGIKIGHHVFSFLFHLSNDSKITQFGEGISKIFNRFMISKCLMTTGGSTLNPTYSQKK